MNRREVLLLLAGTGALPDQLLAIGRTVHKRVRAGTLRALNAHQNETVATIAELIIPKTDTPGAREAEGPRSSTSMSPTGWTTISAGYSRRDLRTWMNGRAGCSPRTSSRAARPSRPRS